MKPHGHVTIELLARWGDNEAIVIGTISLPIHATMDPDGTTHVTADTSVLKRLSLTPTRDDIRAALDNAQTDHIATQQAVDALTDELFAALANPDRTAL